MNRHARWIPALLVLVLPVAAGCGLTDDTPEEAPGNLLTNGSFETWGEAGPLGWDIDQSGRSERLAGEGAAFHGKIAAAVLCLHPEDFVVLEQTIPVKEHGLYRAQLFVRPIMPLSGAVLSVELLGADGRRREGGRRDIRGQVNEWRAIACAVPVPEGTMALRYQIRIGPRAAGNVSIDGARLERMK
jgi:hypothetical protein